MTDDCQRKRPAARRPKHARAQRGTGCGRDPDDLLGLFLALHSTVVAGAAPAGVRAVGSSNRKRRELQFASDALFPVECPASRRLIGRASTEASRRHPIAAQTH